MRARPILLPLLAATLLAACTGAGAGAGSGGARASTAVASNPPSAAGALTVGNRTFLSTGVTGHQMVAATKVTLSFRDAMVSANAGCNSMGGEYHIVGGALAIGSLAMTDMACQQDLMAQDDWLAKLLPGATVALDGMTLTLTKGDVAIAFVDRQTTNLPLEGTTWTLDGLVSGDAVGSVPQGVSSTLLFDAGKAHVASGCNTGTIPVTVADGTITFGPMSMTARACADVAGSVEPVVQAVLQGVQPYRIDGDSLTIGGGGKAGLMFKGTKAAPSPGAS